MVKDKTRLQDLLDAVAEGDKAALEQLYAATNNQLYGAALRILRKRALATAALEEIYLRIWRSAATFKPELQSPEHWLFTIARSTAFDIARKNDDLRLGAYRAPMESESEAEDAPQPTISPELKKLLAGLGELSSDLRKMTLLAYYDGWSRDALAIEFDAPPGTIRTWLLRSLEHIRAKVPA